MAHRTQATPTQNQIRQEVTRYRYGEKVHLGAALERLKLGDTDEEWPVLVGIHEELRDNHYTLVLTFDSPDVPWTTWQEKVEKLTNFFGPDIQIALQRVQAQNPALAKGAQIRAIGLDKAYELAKSVQQSKDQKFDVSFQPEGAQVDAALKILQASGQKTDKFTGIPLFFITGGPQQAQLTVQVSDPKGGKSEEMAPMFFSRQDADAFLAEVKKQDPKIGESAKIQVSSLDRLVAIMEQKNDPQLRQLYFVPSSSALRFIQQQQGNTGNRPQTQPAPQPQTSPAPAPRPQASPAPQPQTSPAPSPRPQASPAPKPQ